MKYLTTLFATCLLSSAAIAAQGPASPPVIERGTIAAVTDNSVTLRSDNGTTKTLSLAKDWSVTVLKSIDVGAIQPGSFIGTTEVPQQDGKGRSLEVHVFPPGVKAGEGHYPWMQPGTMMTNGTVGQVTTSAQGRELRVSYPNGERTVVVPANIPIVLMTGGDRALIKAGVPASLFVTKAADGSASVSRVTIGENGAKPAI